jgi:hypothetical protein
LFVGEGFLELLKNLATLLLPQLIINSPFLSSINVMGIVS